MPPTTNTDSGLYVCMMTAMAASLTHQTAAATYVGLHRHQTQPLLSLLCDRLHFLGCSRPFTLKNFGLEPTYHTCHFHLAGRVSLHAISFSLLCDASHVKVLYLFSRGYFLIYLPVISLIRCTSLYTHRLYKMRHDRCRGESCQSELETYSLLRVPDYTTYICNTFYNSMFSTARYPRHPTITSTTRPL